MATDLNLKLGAIPNRKGGYHFKVWAPYAQAMTLELATTSSPKIMPMQKDSDGYFNANVNSAKENMCYYYCFSGKKFADPASRYQPEGVHGPAQIITQRFPWQDEKWSGIPLDHYIIYELHVGTYTEQGTFTAIIPHLNTLKELGITAIELMPVAQFPGTRNWGYDGVFPFAVQNSYGGPQGLKELVNACHEQQIAIILDVVYNHLGPEGNYFSNFGPYFTEHYHNPWGKALNFDDAYSQHLRRYFIENALHWFTDYHIDALRLDALHGIVDNSAYPFLRELADHVRALSKKLAKKIYLIAESDLNDVRLITSHAQGGFALHAQWNDDFHHALHTLLTHEDQGYYQDFGSLAQLVKAYREGYVYSGQYSKHRKRPHGCSSKKIPAQQFIVFAQNHDQIGNRAQGDRLTQTLNYSQLKLAAACVILSPFIPLIFMGEEYGELAPFQYFISHSDPDLIQAVREGRQKEFTFSKKLPDPQDEKTFLACKLHHHLKNQSNHHLLWKYYQALIHLRKTHPALSQLSKKHTHVAQQDQVLIIKREFARQTLLVILNFNDKETVIKVAITPESWRKIFDSEEKQWGGETEAQAYLDKNKNLLHLAAFNCLIYKAEAQT